jgi:choline-sulfatase
MGQWFRRAGYETLYAGKWHMPMSYTPDIPGFDVITTGINGQGGVCDANVSRACQGYLRGRRGAQGRPFLLIASFLQPHDVCQFVAMHTNHKGMVFHDAVADSLPPLPPNHEFDPHEPASLQRRKRPDWSEQQWRYYLYNYYRMVEMVDAEIGRVLQALDDSGEADNTIVVFTADHGEGRGRHKLVTKNYLYDEAVKVPLIFAAPGRAEAGRVDRANLVSGVDILRTVCDLTGVAPPPHMRGNSLRPPLQGRKPNPREFVAAEVQMLGRMIRTPRFKYIAYKGDPVEQFFDMQADPGETRNLAGAARHDADLKAHRKLLAEWEAGLDPAPVKLPPWAEKMLDRSRRQ